MMDFRTDWIGRLKMAQTGGVQIPNAKLEYAQTMLDLQLLTPEMSTVIQQMNGKMKSWLLRDNVKRKAVDDLTQRPTKVIRTELVKMSETSLLPQDLNNFYQTVYTSRHKNFPPLPKSREELQENLCRMEINTCTGELFLLCNDIHVESGIVVFSCGHNLET